MKKLIFATLSLSAILASASFASCAGNEEKAETGKNEQTKPTEKAEEQQALKIRYIDGDSITANYNFAKDLKESAVRAYSKIEAAQQSKQNELQNFGKSIDSKMKTNGYLSEESYKADMMKFQKCSRMPKLILVACSTTQKWSLPSSSNNSMTRSKPLSRITTRQKVTMQFFSRPREFTSIPPFDITKDVIKGLNERYNKVEEITDTFNKRLTTAPAEKHNNGW